jgi:hypothetical protein
VVGRGPSEEAEGVISEDNDLFFCSTLKQLAAEKKRGGVVGQVRDSEFWR